MVKKQLEFGLEIPEDIEKYFKKNNISIDIEELKKNINPNKKDLSEQDIFDVIYLLNKENIKLGFFKRK